MSQKFTLSLTLSIIACLAVLAVDGQYVEGEHYQRIPIPIEAESQDKIEVIEVFSYGCTHCYSFEKPLAKWVAEQNDPVVQFQRMHVVFSNASVPLALAFYAAEDLGVTDKIHPRMFAAIHDYGLRMNQLDLLQRLFEQGASVEKEKFDEVFQSNRVRQQVMDSDKAIRIWRVDATPTMIVDGRFRITSEKLRSNAEMLDVVDFLIAQIKQDRSLESAN